MEGINGLYVFSLLCYYATPTAAATKTKPIGDDDDRRFTIIVNSASTAAPIGLPPKMVKFCHTPNRLLLGLQCRCALLRLYFNSSATGWLVGRSVGRSEIKVAGLLEVPSKSINSYVLVFFLAVEKVFPPEKKTVLAGASHRTNSPYLFLCRTNFPRVP